LRVATMGLVTGFFLNEIVFLSGRGRSQWVFPTQNMPAIIRLEAGGSTAGFAQLGIVVFVVEHQSGRLCGEKTIFYVRIDRLTMYISYITI